ncbi:PepSY domain-containing protein [Puniceibacterium sediminis]|uniref:Peptidase propeptide and YPEB domain-containing protein n=1 Tax=Puniceibacterium sediminis TaxID=1608407 RepID=A0A238XES8_9RHOB|nr:PepSY domain-containing protein [Puniceibacterium sediminis]SNR57525.1 Peptidase propeptide and YPEB domain-containing protein [Puniceibacterium sediminis]
MTRILTLVLLLAVGAAHASDAVVLDTAKSDEITSTLTAQGYEVRRVDVEDGMFEVYAMKDGKKMELYLDAALTVVRAKISN